MGPAPRRGEPERVAPLPEPVQVGAIRPAHDHGHRRESPHGQRPPRHAREQAEHESHEAAPFLQAGGDEDARLIPLDVRLRVTRRVDGASAEEDARRRDFTINALARRLDTGELVDPFGGLVDLARRELRVLSPQAFVEDPLRLLRGLRLVSQLGFTPTGDTLARMRLEAVGLRHVSAERIGGGLAADGLGELSKLLLGERPGLALRLARETGVLVEVVPEYAAVIGLSLGSDRQPLPLDEHMIAVVQATADLGAPLAVRLAALLHDVGKPAAEAGGGSHAAAGAVIAQSILRRLRYPARMQRRVTTLVREHAFRVDAVDDVYARRFLATHGDAVAYDLVTHKQADLSVKDVPAAERDTIVALRAALERAQGSPHRVGDLAIGGADLIAAGFRESPELGTVLRALLDVVLEDPARNDRESLLALAEELRP